MKFLPTHLFCMCICFSTYAQTLPKDSINIIYKEASVSRANGNYNEAILLTTKGLVLLENEEINDDTLELNLKNLKGSLFYRLRVMDSAIYVANNALSISNRIYGPSSKESGNILNDLGMYHEIIGSFNQALNYYDRALEVYGKLANVDRYISMVYNNIGICYNLMGDPQRAAPFLEKSLDIDAQIYGMNSLEISASYDNIGHNYLAIKEKFDYAEKLFLQSLEIRDSILTTSHPLIGNSYHNLGYYYFLKNRFLKALNFFNQSLDIRLRKLGPNHFRVAQIYDLIGDCYLSTADYDQALQYYNKALDIVLLQPTNNQRKIIEVYMAQAKVYRARQQYEQSFAAFDRALEVVRYQLSMGTSFDEIRYPYVLLVVLEELGATYMKQYEQTAQLGALRSANAYYQVAIELIQFIKSSFREKASKQFLQEDKFHIYEDAIACSHSLYQLTDSAKYAAAAFYVSEKSKAHLLKEAQRSAQAISYAGIPDSLVTLEKELRVSVAYWQEERFRAIQREEQERLSTINDRIFDYKQTYNELLQSMESNYPQYYHLKYNDTLLSVEQLQDYVGEKGAIVEYFFGDSSLYRFVIQKSGISMSVIEDANSLKAQVNQIRKAIVSYPERLLKGGAIVDSFPSIAFALYEQLFGGNDFTVFEELLIIPDGALWYLPFECLLQHVPRLSDTYQSYPYLVQSKAISYAYAAHLMAAQSRQSGSIADHSILTVAPHFSGQQGLIGDRSTTFAALAFNESEALQISKQLDGKALLGTAASREQFIQLAPKYQLLHFATHAEANDESGDYSYLAFSGSHEGASPELLYVNDIYNLGLNADLVVLSACETGLGEMHRGEGIIGLGRAFSYAGASSIINTLWKINDAKTADLMALFYENLQTGQPKDIALQQAKLSYLEQNSARAAHPYFWAAFVPIGDMEAVDLDDSTWLSSISIVVLFLLIGFLFRKPISKRWRQVFSKPTPVIEEMVVENS